MPQNTEGKATTSHVELHPYGRFAYMANRGHGTIAAFAVDEATGGLKLIEHAETEPVVRSFSLSPDCRYLVAAGQTSNMLRCYTVAESGKLTNTHVVRSGKTPWWESFSPTDSFSVRSKLR